MSKKQPQFKLKQIRQLKESINLTEYIVATRPSKKNKSLLAQQRAILVKLEDKS